MYREAEINSLNGLHDAFRGFLAYQIVLLMPNSIHATVVIARCLGEGASEAVK